MIKKSTLSPETYRFSILKFFHFDEEKFNASFENVSLIVKFFSIERPTPFYTLTLFTYTSLLICRLTSVKPVPPTLEFGDKRPEFMTSSKHHTKKREGITNPNTKANNVILKGEHSSHDALCKWKVRQSRANNKRADVQIWLADRWRLFQLFNKFQTLFTRCICINYNKNIDESFYLLFILKLEENI